MKRSEIPDAIKEFQKRHGSIEPLDSPGLYGLHNWAIGVQGDNVVLAWRFAFETGDLFSFSLLPLKVWRDFIEATKPLTFVGWSATGPSPTCILQTTRLKFAWPD